MGRRPRSGYHVYDPVSGYACTYRIARGSRCGRPGKWNGRRIRCARHAER